MDNKKILKSAAALALGIALLAPGANEVYATSTTNPSLTVIKTEKQRFDEKLAEATAKYNEYLAVLDTVLYKNADEYLQNDFKLYVKELEKVIKSPEFSTYLKDEEYRSGNHALTSALNTAEIRKNNLNGKVVDTLELYKLTSSDAQFRASDAFKKASTEQINAYNSAIAEGNRIIGLGNSVLNTEYKNAYNNLVAARNSIDNSLSRDIAKTALENEIKAVAVITKNKDLYTEASYDKFNKALIAANTTINAANSTLEQYQAQLNALVSAQADLKKKATADDEALAKSIADLKEAIRKNEIMVEAAQYLLDNVPNTVKDVKGKLENIIVESRENAASARAFIAEIEKNIQG